MARTARPILAAELALLALGTLFAWATLLATPAFAGGSLDRYVLTSVPSPFPGELVVRTTPIRQDVRCIPVPYSLNVTLDPIPNPLGPDLLSLAEATEAIERSMDAWNDIPTSYAEMRFLGTSGNLQPAGFDTVNEVTFRPVPGFGSVVAVSPSVSLFADSTLTDGTDLDGDGDSDVAAGITTCADVDGDGDWERPEGFYAGGTILDNDVWFNTDVWTFVTEPDPGFRTFDLEAVTTHELGHSHGLAHAMLNQVSPTNADMSSMHPFPDWTDPLNQLDQRTPSQDDASYSSYLYREGSAASGPAALQDGDVAFDAVYGILAGEVTHGVFGVPLPGTAVYAVDRSTGAIASEVYGGALELSLNPATGALRLLPGTESLAHGRYELPVPAGSYEVWIEAVDGDPVPASFVNLTVNLSAALGLQGFDEEVWHRGQEGALEAAPGRGTPVNVKAGITVDGLDLVTNRTRKIAPFGSLRNFTSVSPAPGTYYAVRVSAGEVVALADDVPFAVTSAEFFTAGGTPSAVPRFARALLATGRVLPDGTAQVDLDAPLAETIDFVGQEFDLSPFYFANPVGLGQRIRNGWASAAITDLFLVLQVPDETPFPNPYGFAPVLGIDRFTGPGDLPILGRSYTSEDGGATFTPDPTANYMMGLVVSELP